MQVVKDIIYDEWGCTAQIAERLSEYLGHKVYREHVFVHIHNRPELLRACDDADEMYVDTAKKTVKGALLAGDLGVAKYVLSTKGKKYGWALGNLLDAAATGKVDTVTVQAVTVHAYESDTYAPDGTPVSDVETTGASPDAEAPDEAPDIDASEAPGTDFIIIEGELSADKSDDPPPEPPAPAPGPYTFVRAPKAQAEKPNDAAMASTAEPAPPPAPKASRFGRVSQYDPTPAAAKPPPEVYEEANTRFPRSPQEAAGVARWLWDK